MINRICTQIACKMVSFFSKNTIKTPQNVMLFGDHCENDKASFSPDDIM